MILILFLNIYQPELFQVLINKNRTVLNSNDKLLFFDLCNKLFRLVHNISFKNLLLKYMI